MTKKVALQLRNSEPVRELAKAAAESGFRYISMAFGDEKPLLQPDWKGYVEGIGETFAGYGLTCVQTHAPYYSLLISAEERTESMETALLRSMEATKLLGAELCAVHPRSVIIPGLPRETAVDRKRSLEENLIAFSPLAEVCEKHGVLLGIENLMRYPFDHPWFYSWMAEDHCELIDRLKSDAVCAVWDFGHANLVDTDHALRIGMLGGRIKGTHVHNNGGKEDEHFPPFLPEPEGYYVRRTVDWPAVLTALRNTGYDGYLTLESVFPLNYPVAPYLRYLYDSVCTLEDILRETT